MSWQEIVLYTPADLIALEGEIVGRIPDSYRHETIKSMLESRIQQRYSHLDDVISSIENSSIFKRAGILLNLCLVFRENSIRDNDIFQHKARLYEVKFEEELERALKILSKQLDSGYEIVR